MGECCGVEADDFVNATGGAPVPAPQEAACGQGEWQSGWSSRSARATRPRRRSSYLSLAGDVRLNRVRVTLDVCNPTHLSTPNTVNKYR